MADLRDFLQSMSNSAASNVSAPVDGINWLLGKAGLPVSSAPFMGSDWMAQKGLTRPVQQGAASILGETAGMVAPMAIAAKAPQIARGLLQAGENAMIPRTLNPQTGAIVWHGSPHKFDKFDASKIGTGEGAQAYGHGLYLAESPEVAQGYKTTLSPYELVKDGKQIPYEQMDAVTAGVASDIASKKGDVKAVRSMYESMAKQKFGGDIAKQRLAALDSMGANVGAEKGGSLYKVDLPDEHIARMLDWDKPLSQQSKEVQAAVKAIRPGIDGMASITNGKMTKAMNQSGEDFVDWLGNNHATRLSGQGIPGIRYLDGGSRGTGAGTSNFVVFPGNEDILKIMERNGKGLLAD